MTELCSGITEPPLTVTSPDGAFAAMAGGGLVVADAAGDRSGGATAGACWPCWPCAGAGSAGAGAVAGGALVAKGR